MGLLLAEKNMDKSGRITLVETPCD